MVVGIRVNSNMVLTAGHLLQTPVRLCVNPIYPVHDVNVRVLINRSCDYDSDDDSINNGKE